MNAEGRKDWSAGPNWLMKLNGKRGEPKPCFLAWSSLLALRGKTLDCLRRLYLAAITRTKWVRYFPQSWLSQGFSANGSRGGAQFVIQCGQWQHSALREF